MKKYFTYVPLWISIILNFILGVILCNGFFIAYSLIFESNILGGPAVVGRCLGILIMLGIGIIIAIANYCICKWCRYKRGELTSIKSQFIAIKLLIVLGSLIVGAGANLIMQMSVISFIMYGL